MVFAQNATYPSGALVRCDDDNCPCTLRPELHVEPRITEIRHQFDYGTLLSSTQLSFSDGSQQLLLPHESLRFIHGDLHVLSPGNLPKVYSIDW